MQKVDYLLIGPAHPYKGGIAETQNQLALSLKKLGKNVELFTFTKLYPDFFFFPEKVNILQKQNLIYLKLKELFTVTIPLIGLGLQKE